MKNVFILIIIAFSLLFYGCTNKNYEKIDFTRENGSVILAAYRHLAPGEKDGLYCSRILDVWEPLITRDQYNRPAPCLANSWKMLDNGKEWIFHLRKDVYFHNGSKFNADSVIKNFDRMKKGYKRSSFYGLDINVYYPGLLKYEKIDDYTIKLTFSEANVNELYKMTDFGSPIYAPECLDDSGNFSSVAIGTGPYKIKKNVLNKYVIIERNENYYGEKAKIPKFIIRNIPNADTRYAALKAEEIDGVIDINAIPPFYAEEIKLDDRFSVAINKSTMIRYLSLNGKKFPFNDVRMRKAVSLAINRDSLVNSLYLGYGKSTQNILNYTCPDYKEFPVTYDIDEAKRLAKQVLGNNRCEIVYFINSLEPLQKGEAEIIAYWLHEIGLDVKIKSLEYAAISKIMRCGEHDIVRLQRGLANGDAYGLLYNFIMPEGNINKSNNIFYNNEKVISLMEQVKHITNESERSNIFYKIQEIIVEDQPVVPLYNDVNIVAYNKRLKNYIPLIYGVNLSKVELSE